MLFYRSGEQAFEIYTHYLYEKIFGEPFLRTLPAETLEKMAWLHPHLELQQELQRRRLAMSIFSA